MARNVVASAGVRGLEKVAGTEAVEGLKIPETS